VRTLTIDQDFNTTNAVTYKSYDKPQRAEMVNFKGEIGVVKRSKFNGESQTRSDFKGYGGRNHRSRAIEPPQQVVDLRFDNKRNFDTEQRLQYKGIDTATHKVSEPFVPEDNKYMPPDTKFETMTSQKMDYRPFDVNDVYIPPRKAAHEQKPKEKQPKLDDRTMNNHFFKKWNVEPRKTYGDFHEGHTYVPPTEKFSTVSTTQATYLGKQTNIPETFKPESHMVEATGEHDFNTVYKVTFGDTSSTKKMSKQQKAALYKELKKRKQQNVSRSAPAIAAK